MYAIVEVGARQYNIKTGDIVEVEKLDAVEGKVLKLEKVLLYAKDKTIEVGTPYLKGVVVTAVVLKPAKGEKLISFKYRRRKNSHWKKGHKQKISRLKIEEIKAG
jgi:large subunit ribosomal protein L21